MQDPTSNSPLTLRRAWFSGYRVVDVEVILAQFGFRVSQLWQDVQALKERLKDVEADRDAIERRLGEAHQRELELLAVATSAQGARDQVNEIARQEARAIVDAAHLDAARIRGEAARAADAARGQVDELLRLRGTLSSTMRSVVRDFESLVGDVDAPRGLAFTPSDMSVEAHAFTASVLPPPVAPPGPALARAERPADPAPAPSRSGVFDGRVELDAGPFTDFASLSAFERALGAIPNIEDVYIRRFEGDRATIDLKLEEPAPLLEEMTARLPYQFAVDHSDLDRIAVTVSNGD